MKYILGFLLFTVATSALAINPNKPWALVMRNAAGDYVYVRDLAPGATAVASNSVKVGISGLNGYNNIAQDATGAILKRNLSLVDANGIIKGTEAQLLKPITGTAVDSVIAKRAAIAAAGRFAMRNAIPLVGLGLTAWQLYAGLQDDSIHLNTPGTDLVKDEQTTNKTFILSRLGQTYPYAGTGSVPASAADTACASGILCSWPNQTIESHDGCSPSSLSASGVFNCSYHYHDNASPNTHKTFSPTITVSASTSNTTFERPATDAEIETALSNQPMSDMPAYVQEIAAKGDGTITLPKASLASVTFDHPEYTTSPTISNTTTTNPDGSTSTRRTETTQKITPQSNGTTIEDNTITTTITNITNTYVNNNLVEHNETDQPLPQPPNPTENPDNPTDPCADGACDFTDPDMPAQPHLYDQKYPDGIVGVWNAKSGELQNTRFVTGIKSMFPTLGDGGSCPAWGLDMNIMNHAMYGYQTFGVSCTIWQVVGLIMLTSACFTAWRIIF